MKTFFSQGVVMNSVRFLALAASLLVLSACQMTENAVSSSASGFVSSQVNPVVDKGSNAFTSTATSAGSSAGAGF
jgi:hypothetical protein